MAPCSHRERRLSGDPQDSSVIWSDIGFRLQKQSRSPPMAESAPSGQRDTGGLNRANLLMCELYFTSTCVPCRYQSSCDHTPNGVTIQ